MKNVPCFARPSNAGVWTYFEPMRQLNASANCWSVMIKTTFGREAVAAFDTQELQSKMPTRD